MIIKELKMEGAKALSTPGVAEIDNAEEGEFEEELGHSVIQFEDGVVRTYEKRHWLILHAAA